MQDINVQSLLIIFHNPQLFTLFYDAGHPMAF